MKLKWLSLFILLISFLSPAAHSNSSKPGNADMTTTTLSQNLQHGKDFLAANVKKPGVITLDDGLQYKVIEQGTGQKPKETDLVTVEYEGRLINGKVFDQSSAHGGAASFRVNEVIPGWTEILQLMPKGSTWEVYIPADLAYGAQGAPPTIGPGETLIFKIKLLDINK